MDLFEYVEHPHIRHRQLVGAPTTDQARAKIHGSGWIGKLNNKVGLLVTVAVGSMWCAYLFTVLSLFALPDAIRQGTYFIVVWLSSSFLQLVLLPVIIVGQNIQANASDARAQATYDDASAVLDKATQIQSHLLEIQDHLQAQDAKILAILTSVSAPPGGAPAAKRPRPASSAVPTRDDVMGALQGSPKSAHALAAGFGCTSPTSRQGEGRGEPRGGRSRRLSGHPSAPQF